MHPGLLDGAMPTFATLKAALPLKAEKIATVSGALVLERRHTAWVAEEGVGRLRRHEGSDLETP